MSECHLKPPIDVGVGLRACHYAYIESEKPKISWFEVLSDNYFCESGPSMDHLDKIRASYPVSLHGVGMSLGSTDPLNFNYLSKLKALIKRVNPLSVSDHLCWTSLAGQYFHELLPLPYTEEAVKHTAERIRAAQHYLERQIMIENVSSYLSFKHSTMKEWEFLQAIADEADCLILLDINNIYVSAQNNNFSADEYLKGMNPKRIAQFHLGGFEDKGSHLLDSHGAAIHQPVWELYKSALENFGRIPTIIEWDNQVPNFSELLSEANQAKIFMDKYAIAA